MGPEGLVLSMLIRSSKTDLEILWDTRTSRGNPASLCPAKALRRSHTPVARRSLSPSKYPPPPAHPRLSGENGICREMGCASERNTNICCEPHSFRGGGATALFASGIDRIAVQRWGRRRSFIFQEYVRSDSSSRLNRGGKSHRPSESPNSWRNWIRYIRKLLRRHPRHFAQAVPYAVRVIRELPNTPI